MTLEELASKIDYNSVLMEQMTSQNKAILEGITGVNQQLDRKPNREEFEELKADVKTMRVAVTDQSREVHGHDKHLKNHEHRLMRLESA